MGAKIISASCKLNHLRFIFLLVYSILFGILGRDGTRRARCYALVEEDWYRLQLGAGHGSEGVLRSDG